MFNMDHAQKNAFNTQIIAPGEPPTRRSASTNRSMESRFSEYTSEEEELEQLTYAEKNARHQEYSPSIYNSNLFSAGVYRSHKRDSRIGINR